MLMLGEYRERTEYATESYDYTTFVFSTPISNPVDTPKLSQL
jgi:hypothetical protein